MAQPPAYCNDVPPPPPAYCYQDPGKAPAPVNVTVVQQPAPPKKRGFLSNLMSEVDKVGKQISRELDVASKKLDETIDKNYSSNLLSLFSTGNTIQLLPRATSKTLQVCLSQAGHMMLDANGPHDPRPFNTWWTVMNEGSNQVRLHNNNNYLAIVEGCITIVPVPQGTAYTQQTKFQLSQSGSVVTLECLADRGKYLGFLPSGQPKLPCGTRKEIETQFYVKLLSTAYPVAPTTTTTTTVITTTVPPK